jgi:membrane-bound metal-dependent hydrolase YbcI (DUF457 family)
MNMRAGLVTSQVAWFAAMPIAAHSWKEALTGFVIAGIASTLPDLDHSRSTAGRMLGRRTQRVVAGMAGGHRMLTHSLLGVYFAWSVVNWLMDYDHPGIANAIAVGCISHIFTDILTVQGVGLLYGCGAPFLALAWLLNPLRRPRRTGLARLLQRVGCLLHGKTQVGWIVTGTKAEEDYILLVKALAVPLVCWYGFLVYPVVEAWASGRLTLLQAGLEGLS